MHTESLLRTLHRALPRHASLTLSMECVLGQAHLAVTCPSSLKHVLLQELQDIWPGIRVDVDRPSSESDVRPVWTAELYKTPDVLPVRTLESFIDLADDRQFADPITGLLAALRTGASGRFLSRIDVTIRRASHGRIRSANRVLGTLSRRFWLPALKDIYLANATHRSRWRRVAALLLAVFATRRDGVTTEYSSMAADGVFECRVRVCITGPSSAEPIVKERLAGIVGAFARYNRGEMQFSDEGITKRVASPRFRRGQLMTAAELATLWHPLTESGDHAARIDRPIFRQLQPPLVLTQRSPDAKETVLGRVQFRNEKTLARMRMDDLRRHLLVVGKTGCGKSTFLANVVHQQMQHRRGVVLVDPHGQLADEMSNSVPRFRKNDVIPFDVSCRNNLPRFNPLIGPDGTDSNLVADGVLTSFKNVFGFDSDSAPRLLHIFRNCLLSVIGTSYASLTNVQRMLVDTPFRKSVIAGVGNPAVREFWLTEFQRWNERDRTQYVASLQNKLGAFTSNERLCHILNPTRKGIVLRDVMDRSKLLICNLSKGTVGHDASKLLGSLLLSSLQIAAMSRADVPEDERPDCVVVIDEFHSYLSEGNSTMADALAESRKYRTSYVLSTQMLEGQLDSQTLAGVLGNCGSTLCMTVGPRDAEVLTELLNNGVTAADLMNIPKYHGYLRMLVNGVPHTFSMQTMPPG